jgi:hypothetical protein
VTVRSRTTGPYSACWWVDLGPRQPWVDPPGASTRKAHAACSSDCGPYLVRMIQGASDCPIANDGTLQRVLVGGLGPRRATRRQAGLPYYSKEGPRVKLSSEVPAASIGPAAQADGNVQQLAACILVLAGSLGVPLSNLRKIETIA